MFSFPVCFFACTCTSEHKGDGDKFFDVEERNFGEQRDDVRRFFPGRPHKASSSSSEEEKRFFPGGRGEGEGKRYFPGLGKRYFPGRSQDEEKRYFPGEEKRYFPGEEKRYFPGNIPAGENRKYRSPRACVACESRKCVCAISGRQPEVGTDAKVDLRSVASG